MRRPGRCWPPRFSPLARWDQVPVGAVREAIRRIFTCWGRPEWLRVDNGVPWGSPEDLPPALALWLTGLGIGMIWNRPHHPQENAFVERSQGVLKAWAELDRCRDFAEAQAHVAWAVEMQREHYPAVQGQSRAAAYPALAARPRPYEPAREEEQWEVGRVYQLLERGVWVRRVSPLGQVRLYNQVIGIGQRHGRQQVMVRFDGTQREWVFSNTEGQELARRDAPELSRERIMALDVAGPPRSGPQA